MRGLLRLPVETAPRQRDMLLRAMAVLAIGIVLALALID